MDPPAAKMVKLAITRGGSPVVKRLFLLLSLCFCAGPALAQPAPAYFSRAGHDDAWSGGVRMIPIHTPAGNFRVWTKRVGNNPRLRVLLLHGGPAATHEYFEAFDSFFPGEGIEYIYYDQLGSAYSRPAERRPALDDRPLRRRGRAGPPGAPSRPQQFLPARP